MDKLGMKEGCDVGLEMSGAPAALDQMIDHMVMGGRVALLGVPAQPFIFDLSKIVFRMITLRGIYGREMFETWHKMLAMLESGLDVRKVIARRMKADDYAEAFRLAAAGEKGKIVLDWT
jgi:threonine 3-dehydrogenase